jgi:hypothetical protein
MPGSIAGKNLALDKTIRDRVVRDFIPLAQMVREDRHLLRERLVRYTRIWGVKREQVGYEGRTQTYIPLGRKLIENWVKRIKRDLFPDTDWYDIRALREAFERKVPAKKAITSYFFNKHMRLRRQAGPFLRQLVMLGTSPVKIVWNLEERDAMILRDEIDPETGEPTGKAVRKMEKLLKYIGPTFRPIDLFAWFGYPTTADTVEDCSLTFGELLVSRDRVKALANKPLDPRDEKAGHLYENTKELFDLLTEEVDGGRRGAGDKFDIQARRLRDKGFTHPLEQRVPAGMRPIDLTEAIWEEDLEDEGPQRYLVTVAMDKVVLRVQKNPFWRGEHLHLVGRFVRLVDELYGRGLPEVFEALQHYLNDLADQAGDALMWSVNPIAVVDAYGVQDPESLRMAPGAKWLASIGSVKFAEPPQGPAAAGFAGVAQTMGLANELANVTPVGALGAAQKGRGRSQQTAAGMQMSISEGAVDLREVVEGVEDDVFQPTLARVHQLTEQFLDRSITLRIAGADGIALIETPVSVVDIIGDYEYEWLGSLQALNQQVRSQHMVNFLAMAKDLQEVAQAQGFTIDLKYILREIWGTGMGLRGAERVVRDIQRETGVDWRLENQLFRVERGAEVEVHPKDNHTEHNQGHDRLLADPKVPDTMKPLVAKHMRDHAVAEVVTQLQKQAQMMTAPPNQLPVPAAGTNGGPRPPAPAGPGRMPQTASLDDLFRRMPRTDMIQ